MPPADASGRDLVRVMVIGTSCTGKTTFARRLAERLNVPHIELDALFWRPGWIEREPCDFLALVQERSRGEAWVADGNYDLSRDHLWSRATAVIWLDYPFPLVLWRAAKRTFARATFGGKVCGDNRESWKRALSRDSILLWVLNSFPERRRCYGALFADNAYPKAAKIRLKSPAAAAAFLADITPT